MRPLERHDLVWVDGKAWQDALQAPLPGRWLAALQTWFAGGRPAVVRRRESDAVHVVSLGVALPLWQDKVRIPFLLDSSAVMRTSAPLPLSTALASAPHEWRPALARLVEEAKAIGMAFRVYGSLAWQHLSGYDYVTPTSDVDLLWRVRDGVTLRNTLEMLTRWQRESRIVADGELLLADGAAVAWKELLTGSRKLLLKRVTGVEMRTRDQVLSLALAG
jgi:phosphoribosyl-dephospho-CoA transferase